MCVCVKETERDRDAGGSVQNIINAFRTFHYPYLRLELSVVTGVVSARSYAAMTPVLHANPFVSVFLLMIHTLPP